jgi:hypothetical protein
MNPLIPLDRPAFGLRLLAALLAVAALRSIGATGTEAVSGSVLSVARDVAMPVLALIAAAGLWKGRRWGAAALGCLAVAAFIGYVYPVPAGPWLHIALSLALYAAVLGYAWHATSPAAGVRDHATQ